MTVKKYKRYPKTISRIIDNKVSVLNITEGTLFNLNETASSLWGYLWKPRRFKEMVNYIVKKYKVDGNRAEKDVNEFINKGIKEKMIK